MVLGWFAFWIYIAYASLAGYVGILVTMSWSLFWWICCCCPCWIILSQRSSKQTFTYINNGSQETKHEDPETDKDKQEKLNQLEMELGDIVGDTDK